MNSIRYVAQTDVGIIRENNEDNIRTEFNKLGDQIFIVADGMGGHNAGEVASQLACEIIGDNFVSLTDSVDYKEFLKNSILEANKTIYKKALLDPKCNKMGTTISIVIYTQSKIFTAHIGDSRIYFINEDKILQITKDHTLVKAMIDAGTLKEGEKKYNKYKNVLLQALGTNKKVTIELKEFELPDEFKLLLCSDGLTGEVSDEEIHQIMMTNQELNEKIQQLIDYSNQKDGSDNISVIAIENRS